MNLLLGVTITNPREPVSGGAPPAFTPSLDFSDARNSQYLYALLEDWLM